MATLRQLCFKERIQKRRRCKVAALLGAPMRKGVVVKMAITTPRKPNSAKRKYAKVRVICSRKKVHAHIPGLGPTFIQEYSIVMVEGGSPPDVPGVNYSLLRGLYDFEQPEFFGRRQRRSKFGSKRPHYMPRKKKEYMLLSKKFRKYITPAQRKKFLQLFTQKFNNQEYLIFLKKFRGSMISSGKRSVSYKLFDNIKIYFKKILRKKNLDFNMILKKSIFNLIPVLGVSNVRRGRKVQLVPSLLKFRKRVVLINKWLIKNQKNRSNVRGIKVKDVSRLIASALFSKGSAYDQKIELLKRAYSAKHVLLRMGGKYVNGRAFKRLQRKVLSVLEKKHGVFDKNVNMERVEYAKIMKDVQLNSHLKPPVKEPKKVKPETLVESIGTLFSLIIFFKYKRKYKRVKLIVKDFRNHLVHYWRKTKFPLEIRWKVLWYWILDASESTKKRIKINTKKLDTLKPKYKLVCEDIVKRTS